MAFNREACVNFCPAISLPRTSFHDFVSISFHLPPSPIPRIPPKVAPKRATNPLPSHGLTAEYFSWSKPKETTRPIRPPSQSGKSVFFCGRNQPGAMRKRARKGRGLRTRGPGAQPRHAFGDFRRETKVTRGLGRSAQIRRRRGCQPRTNSRGGGAERPHTGRKEPSLTTCSRRGEAPPRIGRSRGHPSLQNPPGCRAWQGHALAERPLTPQEEKKRRRSQKLRRFFGVYVLANCRIKVPSQL